MARISECGDSPKISNAPFCPEAPGNPASISPSPSLLSSSPSTLFFPSATPTKFWANDDDEVEQLLLQTDEQCGALEENCMGHLDVKEVLRLVGFTHAVASKLRDERSLRPQMAEKYTRMKSETLESSLKIIHEVQEGHKESQAVLMQRIQGLEASLASIQDDNEGELEQLRNSLADKEAECSDLEAALKELEDQGNSQQMYERAVCAEEQLREMENLVTDLRAALADAAAGTGKGCSVAEGAVCSKCGGDGGARDETGEILKEFKDAVKSNLSRAVTDGAAKVCHVVGAPASVKGMEDIAAAGVKWYMDNLSWTLKRMGISRGL
eukprot:CAMPEP_0173432544 /NCGR_PEP_ID=MMETSP1357-20121228/10309_1 /TAXON_ID=77926 /ORGANISM="Hemiselmis rufescens, Strain PCC563" /LENGTH=324 /DNA_ID=CAMNT_0014397153 /DNA_START=29 /DNA_END=1003 /DNA_ORIENTATION=-